jgi:hypothetical protein
METFRTTDEEVRDLLTQAVGIAARSTLENRRMLYLQRSSLVPDLLIRL